MFSGRGLTYYQNGRPLFKSINFDLMSGQILYVRGQNGTGKTTLLKLLSGIIPVSEGQINFHGEDISNNPDLISQTVEYVGHLNSVKNQMKAIENLSFWIKLSGKKGSFSNDIFDIDNFKNSTSSNCSAGQLRRLALSHLIFSDKKIWLLDEPTAALDEKNQLSLFKLIRMHCKKGGVAIISTHTTLSIQNCSSNSVCLTKEENAETKSNFDPFLDGDW